MDLFDQQAPTGGEDGVSYGSTGDMKKSQYMLQLLGTPWNADTLKCILASAEQGMEMRSGYLDVLEGAQDTDDYRNIFEFGTYPSIKENDYFLAGAYGITNFINARGLGYSLIPKNANKSAEQDYWIDIAITEAGPKVETIVEEQLVKSSADDAAVSAAKKELTPVLDALEKQLSSNSFVVDKFSLADVHWTALIHLLSLTDGNDLIEQRPQVKRWFESIKTKKSNCGQSVIAYSLLPSVEDINNRKLHSVEISDY